MINNKILILKNDRAGDLFTSLKLISSLSTDSNNIKIYLSDLNIGFSFFFKNFKIKKVDFNINFIDKILIIFDILTNKYDDVYILTPKSFYFILPFLFRNIRFHAVVYDSNNKYRPSLFLRKFLFNYKIIFRNKINKKSYRDTQIELLDSNVKIDHKFTNLNIPLISKELRSLLPDNFLLFQFRYKFFEKLGWGFNEFNILMNNILTKYNTVLFTSDFELNNKTITYNDYFERNYSIIDTNSFKCSYNQNNKKIFFLKNINAYNLFLIINESNFNLAKEGIFSHISFFHNKKCHNLFNFTIKSNYDCLHEKISYSEWCKGMNFNFSFLNSDIYKASRKILKNI